MKWSCARLHGLTTQSPICHGHSMLGGWGTSSRGCDSLKGSRVPLSTPSSAEVLVQQSGEAWWR